MLPPGFLPYRLESWKGVVREDFASQLGPFDPLTWMAKQPHEQTRHRKSRQIYRAQTVKGDHVYLKVMLGLNERAMSDHPQRLDLLKWRYRPSRAIQTLLVTQRMLQDGLWCPPPLLAARDVTSQGRVRDVFISEAIDLPGLGDLLKLAQNDTQRIAMVQAIAPHIVQLHCKRYLHGDLLPNNLHVSPSLDRVCFMDNDRTRHWPCPLPRWLIRRNLAQLAYRVFFHQGPAVASALIEAYGDEAGWPATITRKETHKILAVATARQNQYNQSPASAPSHASTEPTHQQQQDRP
jgi:hypothetical protein